MIRISGKADQHAFVFVHGDAVADDFGRFSGSGGANGLPDSL